MRYLKSRYLKIALSALFISLVGNFAEAQILGSLHNSSYQQKDLTIEEGMDLKDGLEQLEEHFNVVFLYQSSVVEDKKVLATKQLSNNAKVKNALEELLEEQGLVYMYLNPKTYGIYAPEEEPQEQPAVQEVSGTVTDASSGEPLPGVNISIMGTTSGTSTDNDGTYELTVPTIQDTLVFSFIGYQSQEVPIGGRTDIDIAMQPQVISGDELIVVAYGTVEEGEATSSIEQISYEDMSDRALSNISSALEGAAPGIQSLSPSGQPGSAPSIRIRGFGSINASSSPLYVVDGAVYEGGLSNFNMEDVASVSVLKDAASTALYGSRGANGVIVITTKSGENKSDGLSVKMTQSFIDRAIPEYERVDAFDYYPLMWQSYRNSLISSGEDMATANANATAGIEERLGYNPFTVPDGEVMREDGTLNPNAELLWPDDLNWLDAVQRTGSRQEYSFSYNGDTETGSYYGSLGYVNEEGFVINSNQERLMGRLNVSTQPMDWIETGLNLSGVFNQMNNARVAASTRIDNPFYFTRTIGPIYPVHAHDPETGEYLLDDTGSRFYDHGNLLNYGIPFRPTSAFAGKHIVEETERNRDINDRRDLSGRVFADIFFTDHLKFSTKLSFDQSNSYMNVYGNNIIGNDAPGGVSSKSSNRSRTYTFNQLLEYTRDYGLHGFSLMAGHENYDLHINYSIAEREGQIVEDNYELNNFATITEATSYEDKHRIESFLSRFNYDYDGRYFLSTSYRRDGNSRFHTDMRWDDFYSIGLAWRLDQERFMQDLDWLNVLKLRGTYGRVGNDAGIGYYPYQALYDLGFNNASEPGIRQSALPNSDITWEGQKTKGLAADFGFFENRLSGTLEYYHRNSDDLIFAVQLPLSQGGYFLQRNVGSMVNKGWELQLSGDVIETNDFLWNLGLNLSTNENEITRMPPDQPEIISGTKKLKVGQSIYDYWVRDWQGVDPETGSGLYTAEEFDEDNSFETPEGEILTTDQNNAKYVYAGSAIPDIFGSITSGINYKNFSLSANLTYQLGGKTYDATYAALMNRGTYGAALHVDALDAWQQPGDITDVPKLENGGVNPTSSRWLTDASYLNIRNISLGYTLPVNVVTWINARNAKIFINGENLHWFSKRKGMNVQQSFTGVTSNGYIPARTVTVGMNLNF